MPSAANVNAASPKTTGIVFFAATGTTLPTDATTTLAAAFKDCGYISEDGISYDNTRDVTEIKEMGGSVTLTFKGGKMTMAMEVMGQSQTQEADYEYKDGKLITDGTTLDVKIDGDKLTLTDGTNSMTLQKKK